VDKEELLFLLLMEFRHLPCKNDECAVNTVAYLKVQAHHSEFSKPKFVGPCVVQIWESNWVLFESVRPRVASLRVEGIRRFLRSHVGCCRTDAKTSGNALPCPEPTTVTKFGD
jgi:hypothetical protein